MLPHAYRLRHPSVEVTRRSIAITSGNGELIFMEEG